MITLFKEDIKRHFTQAEVDKGITSWQMFTKVLKSETLWMTLMYRYGSWLNKRFNVPVIKTFLKVPLWLLGKPFDILFGYIHLDADIGKGLYIGHCGGIIVGPVKMGEYCNISQQVVIGIGGKGEFRGIPEIGDRVYIGPGAKIFGKIKIGHNVAIGANAVVSKSIPDNAVVVGNPGRIVSYEGTNGLIEVQDEKF